MSITIKDVAREAGVSVSTVSKVINGHYSISEATAAHVRETMRALGYYPNASAQSFARGATRRVVLLTDLYRNIAFENPHMFEIIAGAEETLRRRGYTLELRGTDKTDAGEAARDIIARRGAQFEIIRYLHGLVRVYAAVPREPQRPERFAAHVSSVDGEDEPPVASENGGARHVVYARRARVGRVRAFGGFGANRGKGRNA